MRYLPIVILTLIGFLSCHENQPQYSLIGPVDSDRTIIVEEFSGARCPNCPQGTQELENLKSIYGSSLVVVTIHAGDFAFKYDDSKYDFTTPAGDEILQILGNPIGYPSAVINRTKGSGQSNFQTFSSKWGSLISEELDKPQTMGLSGQINFNPDTRVLDLDISILPFEDFFDATRLSVMLKEDQIIDPQADRAAESGLVPAYVHKNVLRVVLSDFAGDPLAEQLKAFETLNRSCRFTIPAQEGWWNVDQMSVIAFVSVDGDENKAVIQAFEERIVP